MMTRIFIFLVLALPAMGANSRRIERVSNILESSTVPEIVWYQGESVTLDVFAKRGTDKVVWPSTASSVLRVWLESAPSTLYVNKTNDVYAASTGQTRNTLTPAQSNLATNDYKFSVAVYDSTTFMGIAAEGDLEVRYTPQTGLDMVAAVPIWPTDLDELSDVAAPSPTSGQVLGFDGTNWVAVAAGSGSGDITAVTVSGGLLTGGAPSGSADVALSTNAVRSAVSGLYLSLASGGTVTGETSINSDFFINGARPMTTDNGGAGSNYDTDLLDGQHGSYYTDPDNLTGGTVPDSVTAAKYRQPVIAWSYRDLTWNTTAGAGWTGYEIESGSSPTKRTFGLDAITAAAATDQTGTFKTDWVAVPANFAAFKTTGAIKVTWVSSQAVVGESELRGIRLIGSSDLTGANATDLYTDTTTRDIATSGVPVAVSINRSAFASTTVPAYICAQIDASVEDGDKLAIVSIEVLSE